MSVKSSRARTIAPLVSCTGHAYAADHEDCRLAVARPKQAAAALALAKGAMERQDESVLRGLPLSEDDYTLVGWLGADCASVVDDVGARIGRVQPGDSLVTLRTGPGPTLQ